MGPVIRPAPICFSTTYTGWCGGSAMMPAIRWSRCGSSTTSTTGFGRWPGFTLTLEGESAAVANSVSGAAHKLHLSTCCCKSQPQAACKHLCMQHVSSIFLAVIGNASGMPWHYYWVVMHQTEFNLLATEWHGSNYVSDTIYNAFLVCFHFCGAGLSACNSSERCFCIHFCWLVFYW